MRNLFGLFVAATVLASSALAVTRCSAAVSLDLVNTGVDVTPGDPNGVDNRYVITADNVSGITSPSDAYVYTGDDVQEVWDVWGTGSWVPNLPGSSWIGPSSPITDQYNSSWVGSYTYTLAFNLNGLNPDSAWLSGAWYSDNNSSVFLNTKQLASNVGSPDAPFNTPTFFSATGADFVQGWNYLHFVVDNAAYPNGTLNPTGIQVVGLKGEATPEPTTLVVWSSLAAIGGVVAYRRKKLA